MSPIPSSTTLNGAAHQGTSAPATGAPAATENMFMQLLVAQLRNQDPLNPADGTQFVTQLAQFEQLEQSTNTGQDVTAIRSDLDKWLATPSTSAATQS